MFASEVQMLVQRGYAVLQINYRGSAGLGRVYALAGSERVGRVVQADIVDAMRWAVEQEVADEGRMCIYGKRLWWFRGRQGVDERRAAAQLRDRHPWLL